MTKGVYLRRIWVLMATVFVDMMGYLMVLPLLPFYALDMDAEEWVVGVLVSAFAVAQLGTAPVWGRLSDHYGRRPVILASLAVSAVSFLLFAFADSVLMLLASRLVQGMGAGTIAVVQAYVSDSVPPRSRTEALGWLTVASSAGVMVGPAIGSWSTVLGTAAPGLIAAGLCLLNLLFAFLFLRESAETEDDETVRETPRSHRTPLRQAIVRVLLHPASPQVRLIWIYTGGMMAFMAMNGVIALYLKQIFDISKAEIGYFYVYVGAMSLLMRGLMLGPIVNRLGEVRTLRIGVLSILLGLALLPLATSIPALGAVITLVPVGTALLFPATTSLISQHSPRRETGQSLGVQQAFGGVSRVLGPLWATAVFQYLSVASPFWLASALMGVVGLVALSVHDGRTPEHDEEVPERVVEADASTPENL